MKKKICRYQDIKSTSMPSQQSCIICQQVYPRRKNNSLFQKNYQLIAFKINQEMSKLTFLSTIQRIVQSNLLFIRVEQPSKQSMVFRQIQKNLIFQEHLKQFYKLDKIHQKMRQLIQRHIPNVKVNYMDFKIKNFLILNKYRVVCKANLPYPLSNIFQKQTDSKMSSTKSVQNKVLSQLDSSCKQQTNLNPTSHPRQPNKLHNNAKTSNQKFQIKALTKGIQQMIQNINDNRVLQRFKKQMQKGYKLNCGVYRSEQNKAVERNTFKECGSKGQSLGNQADGRKTLREMQFMRRVQKDMIRCFPEQKDDSYLCFAQQKEKSSLSNVKQKSSVSNEKQIEVRSKQAKRLTINGVKSKPKSKFLQDQPERLHTNHQKQIQQQYGLSTIQQKRRSLKSKNKQKQSKSRQLSRKSKESTSIHPLGMSKRLQTQYSNCSTQRQHTSKSTLMKSKSSSRIPTEYDSPDIVGGKRPKSKSKLHNDFMFPSSKGSNQQHGSAYRQDFCGFNKKGKSKSKLNSFNFKSPSKVLGK